MKAAVLLFAVLLVSGCHLLETDAPAPVVVSPTGDATIAQIAALTDQNASLKAQVEDRDRLARNAAGAVYGAQNANQANPDGLPKEAVSSNLEEAASALPDVSAEEKLKRERDNSRILAGELAAVKAERGQAMSENQALRAKVAESAARTVALERQVAETKAAAEKERAQSAAAIRKAISDRDAAVARANAKAAEAVDEAKRAALQRLGWVLLGLGALFTLVGAFQAYAVVQTGIIAPGNFLKPLVWAGSAGFCFACYWTLNQPWFKWLVIGGGAAGVVALGVFLYAEWSDAKDRRAGKERAGEADEAEGTLSRIIEVVDTLPQSATVGDMLSALKSKMDDAHKALIHELRAEKKENFTMSDKDPAIADLQRQIGNLDRTVGELNKTIVDLRILVAELSLRVKVTSCPDPGACVRLGDEVNTLRDTELREVRELCMRLKTESDEKRGERTIIGIVCTVVGSLVGALVSAWIGSRS